MIPRVDDRRLGSALRAVRLRRNLRQKDVAALAVVSVGLVCEIEQGRVAAATLESLRRVAAALDVNLDLVPHWRGAEMDRLLNVRHNELGVAVAAYLKKCGWEVAPEVSFSIYGERGVIDILAWHAPTRTLLVIELKTEIVDPQGLIGTLDKKTRLARRIGRDRGWQSQTVATWLVVAECSTNRHRVDRFAGLLRSALPADGSTMRRWLRSPSGSIAGLSYFSEFSHSSSKRSFAARRRVRLPKPDAFERDPSMDSPLPPDGPEAVDGSEGAGRPKNAVAEDRRGIRLGAG